MYFTKLIKKPLFPLFLLFLCSLPAVLGILHGGFFISDDGNWMIIRLSAFFEVLRHGQIPARFLTRLNNGFGYPVTDFLYPLFLYIGSIIHIFGINFTNSIKIIFAGSLIGSSFFSFLWLQERFQKYVALFGALVYLYFPYHLWDTYKRGSIGEVLALAIIPFIFWQIEKRKIVFTAIGLALLILSHNTLAFLFFPVVLIYALLRKISLSEIFAFVLLGLGISSFFWIPALFERKFTIFDTTQVSVFAKNFITSSNYGLIGIIFLVIIVQVLFTWKMKKDRTVLFFFFLTLLSIFLTLPISSFVWQVFPFTPFIQFPFRLLSLVIPCVAFLSAHTLSIAINKRTWTIVIIDIFALIISAAFFILPTSYQYYPDSFYATNQDTTTVQKEYTPIWAKNQKTTTNEKIIVLNGFGKIISQEFNGNTIKANVLLSKKSFMEIEQVYFPGWQIFVDGKQTEIFYTNSFGLMQFTIDAGLHSVVGRFSETPFRLFADSISVLSVCIILILLFKKQYD